MTSRKKKIALFTIGSLLIFLLGMVIGVALARPYFKSTNMVNLTISRAYQAYSFAKDFGNDEPIKAKQHLLLELELNLSKLMLMKEHLVPYKKKKLAIACQL